MARRRGFFAELQHQAAVAERNRQRAAAAAVREANRQSREAERARAAAARAQLAAERADARSRAAAEREAKRLHVEAQEAEVEARNAHLNSHLADIDDVLGFTLGVDDFFDLNELRQVAKHPEFVSQHSTPTPLPKPIVAPPEPVRLIPPAPTGLTAVFKKKQYAAAVEAAQADYETKMEAWRTRAAAVPVLQMQQVQEHQAAEADRAAKLAADRASYDEACRQREAEVAEANAKLDVLIAGHQAGAKDAVEEYFGIVFGNSVYPEGVAVDFEQSYKPADKELEIALSLPAPNAIPTARSYKYVKSGDEIREISQTAKEQRERYNALVNAIVLRTLHEVWEADRLGHVDTISLVAAVEHIDRATGQHVATPVAAVAAKRAEFESFDLARVTPAETLKRLNAVISTNAHELRPIDLSAGVRD